MSGTGSDCILPQHWYVCAREINYTVNLYPKCVRALGHLVSGLKPHYPNLGRDWPNSLARDKKALTIYLVRALYDLIVTSYFLWHLAQLSFMANALVPLWHAPQNFPASMSFMVMASAPFFILKRPD
jgi:hypothetical protein